MTINKATIKHFLVYLQQNLHFTLFLLHPNLIDVNHLKTVKSFTKLLMAF